MRRFKTLLFILLLLSFMGLGIVGSANASLIGDIVTVSILILDINNSPRINASGSNTIPVAAGDTDTSDAFSLSGFQIDPFGAGVNITRTGTPFGFGSPSNIVFSDLDWLPDPGQVTGVNVTSNLSSLLPPNTSFTNNSATVGFTGSFGANGWLTNETLTITVDASHSPVPTPSAMLLFGSGLAGLVGWRWWSTCQTRP